MPYFHCAATITAMQDMPPRDLERFLESLPAGRCAGAGAPCTLLDVREQWEFDIVHLPGSVLIPLSQLPQRLAGLDADRPVVVICHHGVRSRTAAKLLEQSGFTKVINLKGGIDAWARELNPNMPVYG